MRADRAAAIHAPAAAAWAFIVLGNHLLLVAYHHIPGSFPCPGNEAARMRD